MKPTPALLALALLAACAKPPPPPPPYNLSLDMKELMGHVVDPGSWAVWKASGVEETLAGEKSLTPKTDEGWLAAESGAAEVAESGNLLLLPGRARDDGQWRAYAEELTRQGLLAKAAAEAHDSQKLYDTGAAIYQVCTSCHAVYVMPYLPKETRKLPGLPDWPAEVKAKQAAFQGRKG
jgi:cytochrome c553